LLILDAEQQKAVDEMVNTPHRAALLGAETGVGKTLMSVELAKRIDAQVILVIGPIQSTVVNAWKKRFHGQGVDLPFKPITSSTQENYALLRQKVPSIYYIGREFFHLSATRKEPTQRKDGTWTKGREALWSWDKVHPDLAIFDEVQTASNRNSNTYLALKHLNAGYKIASSATPQGNKFTGLWSVCRWLWPKTTKPDGSLYVDNSFWRWAATWATVEDDFFSGKKVTGEITPGAFVNSLPCYIRIEATRKPVDERIVYIDLTERERDIYDQMENAMLVWFDEHPLVVDFPIVKGTRLRQMALGEVTLADTGAVDEDGEPVLEVTFEDDCQSSKLDALQKIIGKHHPGEPLLIYTDSAKFARVVTKRLGPNAREWSGATSQKDRAAILAEFGKSVQYIVAVISAISEGVDGLQHVCNTEVWLNESLNEMHNTQAQGRLNRRGQPADEIIRYKLIARNTNDDNHFKNLVRQRIENRAILARR